ncbi:MAG: M23 family metallopeptidase, partial [Minisyncoccia bacterium]
PLVVGSTLIIPNGELSSVSTGVSNSAPPRCNTSGNPYRGGSGAEIDEYYANPMPGGILTQGLHGENAVDIAGPRGAPVLAAAAGTVIIAADNGSWNGGYGNYVVIAHDNGTETLYAHLQLKGFAVSVGQSVAQGQVLGKEGSTGDATGPHVHFEVRGAENLFAATCAVGEKVGTYSCD